MDDPVADIRGVVLQLTKGSRTEQQQALERYFTKDASFKHPFCAVSNNREPILRIFQWYKLLSPHIDIAINSIAYDQSNNILYVNISQIFKIWFVPRYRAPVNLTTILHLKQGHSPGSSSEKDDRYYIISQNDLYQVDQFVRFFLPWGIGIYIVMLWHWFATLCCIIGVNTIGRVHWFIADRMGWSSSQMHPQLANGEATEAEQRRDLKNSADSVEQRAPRNGSRGEQFDVQVMERQSNLAQSTVP